MARPQLFNGVFASPYFVHLHMVCGTVGTQLLQEGWGWPGLVQYAGLRLVEKKRGGGGVGRLSQSITGNSLVFGVFASRTLVRIEVDDRKKRCIQ